MVSNSYQYIDNWNSIRYVWITISVMQYKALVSGFSMIMETVFAIMYLVTGILMVRLHISYCVSKSTIFGEECNSVETSFLAVPVISFLCTAGWVRCVWVCVSFNVKSMNIGAPSTLSFQQHELLLRVCMHVQLCVHVCDAFIASSMRADHKITSSIRNLTVSLISGIRFA